MVVALLDLRILTHTLNYHVHIPLILCQVGALLEWWLLEDRARELQHRVALTFPVAFPSRAAAAAGAGGTVNGAVESYGNSSPSSLTSSS